LIVDTHVHVFTNDRKTYPQIRDTAHAGSIPSIEQIGQTAWPVTSVETLIEMMDAAGIDKASLVQAYFVYEFDNRYTIDATRAHRDRFVSVVVLDPMDPTSPDTLSRLVEEQDVSGIRFMRGRIPNCTLGDPATLPLWDRIQSLKIPLTITDQVGEIGRIRAAMDRYPDVKVGLDHAWGHKIGLPPYESVKNLFAFAGNPNVFVKIAVNNFAAVTDAGGTSEAFFGKLVEQFGADRIMWSSNYPAHPKFGGIHERLALARKELAFLPQEDQQKIFGDTAVKFYPGLR
jgi:L-fuconolactonase